MSNVANQQNSVTPLVAAVLISLFAGGAIGYYTGFFLRDDAQVIEAQQGATPGGGGGGGGAQVTNQISMGEDRTPNAVAITRLVNRLAALDQISKLDVTAEQGKKILPILKQLAALDKLDEQDCSAKLKQIQAILSEDQIRALGAVRPLRPAGQGAAGGQGGPGQVGTVGLNRNGNPTGAANTPPPPVDPLKPFENEQNKRSLENLISSFG